MEPEFEGSDDAKIPSSAAHRPEKVRVLGGAGLEHAAIGSDHVHREKIVAGEAKPTRQVAVPTRYRQAGNAGRTRHAAGGRQAERQGFVIEIAPGAAALGSCRARGRI